MNEGERESPQQEREKCECYHFDSSQMAVLTFYSAPQQSEHASIEKAKEKENGEHFYHLTAFK
jgi:hypothetical protein